MQASPLRIAVAGLGRIGWNYHCRVLKGHADFDLVAVSDTDEGRRAEAVSELGCQAFSDVDEMIATMALDVVVIATPTHLHEAMVMTALAAGVHILLEKPMAMDYAEAVRIVEAAEAADRVLTVYQPHRHNAYFQHLQAIVESGRIGRIHWVQRGAFSYSRRNDWQSLLKYGGGMLNNYGAHYLDQVLQLIGYDVERVFCSLQIVASLGDADDVVKVVLETGHGVVGECTINQASVAKPYDFIVWGTCGSVSLIGKTLEITSFDPAVLPSKELNASLASVDRKYPQDALELVQDTLPVDSSYGVDVFADLAQAVRTGSPVAVPPRETLALMDILRRCRESSQGIRDFR